MILLDDLSESDGEEPLIINGRHFVKPNRYRPDVRPTELERGVQCC